MSVSKDRIDATKLSTASTNIKNTTHNNSTITTTEEETRDAYPSSSSSNSTRRRITDDDIVYVSSPIKATIGSSWKKKDEGANVTLTKNSVFRVIRSGAEAKDELWRLELLDIFNNSESHQTPQQKRREKNIFFSHEPQYEAPLKVTNPQRLIRTSSSSPSPSSQQQQQQQQQQPKKEKRVSPHTLTGTISSIHGIYSLRRVGLPDDVGKYIMSFLEVENLNFNEVSVTSASSTRGHFPIESVLGNDKTWWLSAKGSMHNESCEEHLEFRLCPNGTIQRLSYVGVSIPPLPHGPVSVRRFRMDYSQDNGNSWRKGGERYTLETMDFNGMQTFKLCPPIDASNVRLVCLQNAFAAENVYILGMSPFDCIGLFHVRFM